MAFQEEQRATPHSNQTEEGSAAEELEKKKKPRKRQANGDISEGPSTKKTKQSSSLSSETPSCEEFSTGKEETISKVNSEKATPCKRKALDDVSSRKRAQKQPPPKASKIASAKKKAFEICSKVKEQYSQLSRHASGRPMNPVQYLTHCTNEKRRGMIESTGKLLAKSTQRPHNCPLAVGQKIKGVWLTATTERSGTPLKKSPYGTERVNIALLSSETIGRWSLFFESTYYFKDPIQYARFVLLDTRTAEQEHITWCEDYLLKVDIEQNPFVYWNGEQLLSISNHDHEHAHIYVEILKVGEIETRCRHWDKVKETLTMKNNDASANLGLCPLLRSEGDSSVGTGTATE